jgi:hypothetical protein
MVFSIQYLLIGACVVLIISAYWIHRQSVARAHMRTMELMAQVEHLSRVSQLQAQVIPHNIKLEPAPKKLPEHKYEAGQWMFDEEVPTPAPVEQIDISYAAPDVTIVRSVASAEIRRLHPLPGSMSCPWCHGKRCERCRWESIVPICSRCYCPLLWNQLTSMWICTSSTPH